ARWACSPLPSVRPRNASAPDWALRRLPRLQQVPEVHGKGATRLTGGGVLATAPSRESGYEVPLGNAGSKSTFSHSSGPTVRPWSFDDSSAQRERSSQYATYVAVDQL